MPGVSLVITCHNHERFLADAIDSALSQERAVDEILVVDDGSTDGSAALTAGYPGLRCIRQPNRGLSAARNAGLAAADSQYIVFLDADDRLLPGAIAAGLECFAAHPYAAFVYGAFRHIDAAGDVMHAMPLRPCRGNPYWQFLQHNPVGMHACVMYRRTVVADAGGFDERLRACEDYDLYLRLARHGAVVSHDALVAEYRLHGANMSGDPRLMLGAALEVVDRQRAVAGADPGLAQAWREGRRAWQDYYGIRLAGRAAQRWRDGARVAALGDLAFLLRNAPRVLVSEDFHVGRILVRRLLRGLPQSWRRRATWRRAWLEATPVPGSVAFGDLRRLTPLSREFGYERGRPIDRYYIERFLHSCRADIRGRVLEVGDDGYTVRYGGEQVAVSDVLNVRPGGRATTIVSDLTTGAGMPDAAFDCLIITQTLQLVFDVRAAVRTTYRILRPGGVLLLTVPGTISHLEQGQWRDTWFWGFGPLALQRLFAEVFPADCLELGCHGSVLTCIAFLEGIAAEELTAAELDHRDELYPLLLTLRAVKPAEAS